jgi:hypothetical protein
MSAEFIPIGVVFLQHLAKKAFIYPEFHCAVTMPKLASQHQLALGRSNMLKFVILGTASLALVGSAAAADLPRPQPVYSQAPVGKAPIGKAPIGKYPVGKAPAPIVTKG